MVIPNWLNKHLSAQDLVAIEQKIAQIETQTEAEIIPVVVRASSQYRQSFITLNIIGLLIFSLLWDRLITETHWDAYSSALVKVCLTLVGIFILSRWLSTIPWVQRLATLRSEELEQCHKRAQIEFYANRLNQTQDGVGVLIFVSMLEHVVIVRADQKIAKILPPETWQNVVDEIVKGLKSKKMANGLIQGLEQCSDLLIRHFPVKSGDVNELPNKVIIKDESSL